MKTKTEEYKFWDAAKPHKVRSQYIFNIIINACLIYFANRLLFWHIGFLTQGFTACLWLFNIVFGVSIVGNILLLIYDDPWFKNLYNFIQNMFSFIAIYTLYKIFPFDFQNETITLAAHIILIFFVIATAIAQLVYFMKLAKSLAKGK